MSASKGELITGLDSLPETMSLSNEETYGPLDGDQLRRLREAVVSEFPITNGTLRVQKQNWDELLVAMNSGASRRFALLRRLQPNLKFDAVITPYSLEERWWQDVCRARRFIGVEDGQFAASEIVHSLSEVLPAFDWMRVEHTIYGQYDNHAAFLVIPTIIPGAPIAVQTMIRALLDRLSMHFELGRYLAERACQSRMKGIILERSSQFGFARQIRKGLGAEC